MPRIRLMCTGDSYDKNRRPGWPEMATALLYYLILIAVLAFWILETSAAPALRAIVAGAINGFAGISALLIANAIRIRSPQSFGLIKAEGKWLLLGAGLGLLAFALSFLIEGLYFHFIDEANTQADFQAAAKSGSAYFTLLILTGAILTPLGEEFLFRGVIANALRQYGRWAGVVMSALIFAAVHGPSVIFLLAFMVGIMSALLLYKTNSLWPGVVLHCVYNGLHLSFYSLP